MTSTASCTVPGEPLKMLIRPAAAESIGTTTVSGMLWPGWKFRLEVAGRPVPAGHTVMKPPACGEMAVTVSTAAAASAGMPALPATCTVPVD